MSDYLIAKNSKGKNGNIRSVCPQCGHFLAEVPLMSSCNATTLHKCPNCRRMVETKIRFDKRLY